MVQAGKPKVTLLREVNKNFAGTAGVPRTVPGRPGYVAPSPPPTPKRQSQPGEEGLKGSSLPLPGHDIFVNGESSSLPVPFITLLPLGDSRYLLSWADRIARVYRAQGLVPGPNADVPPFPSLGN